MGERFRVKWTGLYRNPPQAGAGIRKAALLGGEEESEKERRYASGHGAWASQTVSRRGLPHQMHGRSLRVGRGAPRCRRLALLTLPIPLHGGVRGDYSNPTHILWQLSHMTSLIVEFRWPFPSCLWNWKLASFPLCSAPGVGPSLSLVPWMEITLTRELYCFACFIFFQVDNFHFCNVLMFQNICLWTRIIRGSSTAWE